MNKRKSLIVLMLVAVLSVLLFVPLLDTKDKNPDSLVGSEDTGVSKPGQNNEGEDHTVLNISVSLTGAEFAYLQAGSEQFMREHEGVTVNLENIAGGEQYEYLKNAGRIGDGPDLMLIDNGWVQEFSALGFLAPVSEYFTADAQSQYVPSILEQVKWNGYLWGVPKDIDPYILVWNEKKAAEGEWTKAPGSKQELMEWNKRFLKPEEDSYGVYFDTGDYLSWLSLYSAFIDELPLAGQPLADAARPAVVAELQQFLLPQLAQGAPSGGQTQTELKWDAKQFALNYPLPTLEWDPWTKLNNGQIAAMVTTVSAYRNYAGVDVELSSLPATGSGQKVASWLKGRSYCLSSRSENTAAAMEWIKSVTALQQTAKEWTETGMLPVLLAGYSEPALTSESKYNSFAWLVQEGKVLPFSIDSALKTEQVRKDGRRLQNGQIDFDQFSQAAAADLDKSAVGGD